MTPAFSDSWPQAAALFAPLCVYTWLWIAHRLLPARIVSGYVDDPQTGRPYRYRINGLLVLLVTVGLWLLLCWQGVLSWDWFYQQRWLMLSGACTLGLLYTLIVVLPAPATGKGLFTDLFLGRVENQQYGGFVDVKMALYLMGAVLLVLNTLSFGAYHGQRFGSDANPGVWLHCGLLCFFVLDYFSFERVHLYTYDLFAERIGFKLGWGCLVFYPFFYAIGLWGTVDLPAKTLTRDYPVLWLPFCAAVFFCGWMIARGANMQKYRFKTAPQEAFLGRIQPLTIQAGNQQLLCSGFWGVARHVNYLGEILMATGLALSLGQLDSLWPWLYPLYYIALLVPRERDDDRRCAEKYGQLWSTYRQRVPYRIVPGIY